MRAIVIKEHGGPEVLSLEHRPDPVLAPGQVLIEVKAFGLNHAETYFRSGAWGDVAEITGIECVGRVRDDPSGHFPRGGKVAAIVGGLGRSLNGSYAELVAVPRGNVVSIDSDLPWEVLASVPESYATAWSSLIGVLEIQAGQTILIRGGTSALGQAAINIAVDRGAHVLATTRKPERIGILQELGARQVLLESPALAARVCDTHLGGINAVLDIVGNTTVLDSLAMLRRGGRACVVGFLGGGGPLTLEPVFQIPSGRFLTTFASALVTGGTDFPLAEIPFQEMIKKVATGTYRAQPARVFQFNEIQAAHRALELGAHAGKLVVVV